MDVSRLVPVLRVDRRERPRRVKQARVVHITPALFGEDGVYGGAERYSFEMARHMARVAPTTLVSFAERPRTFTTPEGLRIWVLGPPWRVRGQRFNPVHSDL